MSRQPSTFYRYRAFNTDTLDSLCYDTLYFANPGIFNDPLDCRPTLNCDSELVDLRDLYAKLVRRRVINEVHESLKKAGVRGEKASTHAHRQAKSTAGYELANIAYNATNPELTGTKDEIEAGLLTYAIEEELRFHYERGVCCFSESYSSLVLWSHYGDQHRGLCVGYGTDRTPKPQPQKVDYGKNSCIMTSALVRAFIHDDSEARHELDRNVLLRKAGDWRYEREWRLIGPQGLQASPFLLKEVIFGLRCSDSVKHSVVKALSDREKTVRFYEICAVSGQYALRREQVNLDDFLPRVAVSLDEVPLPDIDTFDESQTIEPAQAPFTT